MNPVSVTMYIKPDDSGLPQSFSRDKVSTAAKMQINRHKDNFCIIYPDSEFQKRPVDQYLQTIIDTFNGAMKGQHISLRIDCINDEGVGSILDISDDAYTSILELDKLMDDFGAKKSNPEDPNVYRYNRVDETIGNIVEYCESLIDWEDDDAPEEPEYSPEVEANGLIELKKRKNTAYGEMVKPKKPSGPSRGSNMSGFSDADLIHLIYGDDDDYDDEDDDKPKKKKKKKPSKSSETVVRKSYSMMASKSPKTEYKHHGVIVVKDKKPIKHDAKIILEILKKFIPGDQAWKKEFRKELAERWLGSYVVTKKKLERLEKEYKKKRKADKKVPRKPIFDPTRALQVTDALIHGRTDSWSDPRR